MMAIRFRDRTVRIDSTLVLADLHLGRAATSAVEAPVADGRDILDRLDDILAESVPETVVLAGDVLHSFETVPRGVTERLEEIADRVDKAGSELIVVPGNHDTMLDSVWDGSTTEAYWIDEETVVVHGHERPDAEAHRYVIGHDHPTIEIQGQRHPCFLEGQGGPDRAELLVLPAFNRFTAGVPINGRSQADFQSPLVVDADALQPVVRDATTGETLRFPPLGSIRHRLS